MWGMGDLQSRIKQAVAEAAVEEIRSGMVLGLGSGSTAALMIQALGEKLRQGQLEKITAVSTSFQSQVLASKLAIPLVDLNQVEAIDLAIDGADEVDPGFQLIKGGGACHVQEKLVASAARRFVVMVDASKLVNRLNLGFLLPVEVLPGAWTLVHRRLRSMGAECELRIAQRKAGPVVTDQGNLVLDARFPGGIGDGAELERQLNSIPGVVENGLFIHLVDQVLVGEAGEQGIQVRTLTCPDGPSFTSSCR